MIWNLGEMLKKKVLFPPIIHVGRLASNFPDAFHWVAVHMLWLSKGYITLNRDTDNIQ